MNSRTILPMKWKKRKWKWVHVTKYYLRGDYSNLSRGNQNEIWFSFVLIPDTRRHRFTTHILSAANHTWYSGAWLCTRLSLCIWLCVITFCNQEFSKINLWIFVTFTADSPCILPWKWLAMVQITFKTVRTNDPKFAIFIWLFPKRRTLANRNTAIARHGLGGW